MGLLLALLATFGLFVAAVVIAAGLDRGGRR